MTDGEQSGTAEPRPAIQRVSGPGTAVEPESDPVTAPVHPTVEAVLADVGGYFAGDGATLTYTVDPDGLPATSQGKVTIEVENVATQSDTTTVGGSEFR